MPPRFATDRPQCVKASSLFVLRTFFGRFQVVTQFIQKGPPSLAYVPMLEFGQFAQELFFARLQSFRNLDVGLHQQITCGTTTRVTYPASLQSKHVPGLGPRRNRQSIRSFQRGNVNLRAESGLSVGDRHLDKQVGSFAFEQRMGLDVDEAIAVPRWSPLATPFPFARQPHPHPVIHAGGNRDVEFDLAGHLAVAAAILAGVGNDLSRTVAGGTGGLDTEDSGRLHHLTVPVTPPARFRCRSRPTARSTTLTTHLTSIELDLSSDPSSGLFEREGNVALDIRATRLASASPATSTENVPEDPAAKDVAEGIEDVLHVTEALSASRSADPRMPILVVAGSLLRVAQHFVGFGRFLESKRCLVIPGVAIRVKLNGESAVGLSDFARAASRDTPRTS